MTHRFIRLAWTLSVRLTGDGWLTRWVEERYYHSALRAGGLR
jgi:hypothetical protein